MSGTIDNISSVTPKPKVTVGNLVEDELDRLLKEGGPITSPGMLLSRLYKIATDPLKKLGVRRAAADMLAQKAQSYAKHLWNMPNDLAAEQPQPASASFKAGKAKPGDKTAAATAARVVRAMKEEMNKAGEKALANEAKQVFTNLDRIIQKQIIRKKSGN